jgi:hypothetical protein
MVDGDFSWTYESVDEERRAAVQVTFVTALYLGDLVTMCAALSAGADVNLDLSSVWRRSPTLRWFTPIKAATVRMLPRRHTEIHVQKSVVDDSL